MGDNTTYKVNDDGSVTVAVQMSEQEQNIVEILRIEKSKGGIFASRRMKLRAIKYAKSVNYPDFKVDKLMLDNYPDDFANYPRNTSLIVWFIIGILFLCGAILFVFPSYYEFESASDSNRRINAIEEYQRTGDNEKYCRFTGIWIPKEENYRIPSEQLENDLIRYESYRNREIEDMMWFLFGVIGCLSIAFVSLKRSRRIAKQINSVIKNES